MLEQFEKLDRFSHWLMYTPMRSINWFFVLVFVTCAIWLLLCALSAWAVRKKATPAIISQVVSLRAANAITRWRQRVLTELGPLEKLSVLRILAQAKLLRVELMTEGLSYEDALLISREQAQSLWVSLVRARRG